MTLRLAEVLSLEADRRNTSRETGTIVPYSSRRLFLPLRDEVSWTAPISRHTNFGQGGQALKLYDEMRGAGVRPNSYTLVAALKACSSLKDLESARRIHAVVVRSGLEFDVYVGTMLVDVYAKCGNLVDARNVFEKMTHRSVVSWNTMILGYAHLGQGKEALRLFARMEVEGVRPNNRTFVGALKACSSLAACERGDEADRVMVKVDCSDQVKAIYSKVVKSGYGPDVFVETMLVDVFAKCGKLLDARRIFDNMAHRNVVSWTAMIIGYAQMDEGEEALKLYVQMQQEGVVPNDRTFLGALKACSSLAAAGEGKRVGNKILVKERCLEQVRAIHSQVVQRKSSPDVFVRTMLVDAYAKCGSLVDARRIFEKIPHRNVVSWNAMIMGYVQMGDGEGALQLYAQMQQEGVEPDDWTYVSVLKACGVVAGLEKGKEIHAQICERGIGSSDLFVPTALIDMYGKCGSMENAQKVFDSLPTRNLVPLNALIAGYAHKGESERLFHLVERMRQEGTEPDSITFLSVLTVCGHAGLVDKGLKYFEAMSRDCGITPASAHYYCMVDLLGRAGQLSKALEMVKAMPFAAKGEAWRSVLAACQKWSNVEIARQAFEGAVSLNKKDAAAYALMSNIYAAARMWENAKEIQAMRLDTQAWKHPGQTMWTDMGGLVHSFTVGD